VFSLDGENSFAEERPGNHVFDKMLVVGDYQTLDMFLINYGGVSARNILAVFPAVSRPGGTIGAFAAVVHPQDNSNSDNQNAAMDFYNWTFLNLYDYSVNTFNDGANFPNRALTNNINHQPNAGVTESAPIDIGTPISGFTPRNPGRRNSPTKVSASLSLANGATSGLIDYPAGTGQADYSSGGRHGVIFGDYVSAPHYYSYRDDCALTFEAGGFRVQNLSGGAWSGTATFNLDQSTLATETAYASPPTIPLPTPQVGSNALIAQTGRQSYLGFDTFARTVLARGAL